MKGWFSPLLFLLATSSEDDLRRQIKFLKAENEMLRSRVPKKKIFLTNDERERLLKLGEAIGSARNCSTASCSSVWRTLVG